MTKESTRYIRTVCHSVSAMMHREPTMANYLRATKLLADLRLSMELETTRRGAEIIDRTLREIDSVMFDRRIR